MIKTFTKTVFDIFRLVSYDSGNFSQLFLELKSILQKLGFNGRRRKYAAANEPSDLIVPIFSCSFHLK